MSGHRAASHELARRDAVMARLVDLHGPMRIEGRPPVADRFGALARNIVFQQLAGRAAAAIWARTQALVPDGAFDAAAVAALDEVTLRSAGLSGAKAAALADLATKVHDGTVRLHLLGRLSDDEVVTELVQVRGIGPWTAHMFLMFHLHRMDVWPTGDFGVRNGYRLAYDLPAMPTPKELQVLGDRFAPYRSVAAWYCWRAVDGLVLPA